MKTLWLVLLCFTLMAAGVTAQEPAHDEIVYANDAGEIVALNPTDNTQRTLLTFDDPLTHTYGFYPSPDGAFLAVFVRYLDPNQSISPMRLMVVSRAGERLLDQTLLPEEYIAPEAPVLGDSNYELSRALGEVVWSPDGRRVAFISAHTGDAEAFVFDPAAGTLTQMTGGAQTAAYLAWTPDSNHLFFSELVTFGSGSGVQVAGYLLADALNGTTQAVTLPEPAASTGLAVVGWLDARRMVYAPLNFVTFGASGLFTLNLDTQEIVELLPTRITMNVPVMDAVGGAMAFVVPEVGEIGLVPGAYLWPAEATEPTLLQTGTFYDVSSPYAGRFQFEAAEGSYLFAVESGSFSLLPAHSFGAFLSPVPDVDAVVLSRGDGVYISRHSADDASLVWPEETQVPLWSSDGARFYSFGFTDSGAGLVEVNALERTTRLLDSRMAVTSPRAILAGR